MPGAGFEPADLAVTCSRRNPRLRSRPTRSVKVHDNHRGIESCEATVRTWTSWVRARRGTGSTTSQMRLDGRARTSNPRLPRPVRCRLRHVQVVLTVGFEPTLTAV